MFDATFQPSTVKPIIDWISGKFKADQGRWKSMGNGVQQRDYMATKGGVFRNFFDPTNDLVTKDKSSRLTHAVSKLLKSQPDLEAWWEPLHLLPAVLL